MTNAAGKFQIFAALECGGTPPLYRGDPGAGPVDLPGTAFAENEGDCALHIADAGQLRRALPDDSGPATRAAEKSCTNVCDI